MIVSKIVGDSPRLFADLQAHLSAPHPKRSKTQTFVPKAKRKPKKMSFIEKIKAQRDRLFG